MGQKRGVGIGVSAAGEEELMGGVDTFEPCCPACRGTDSHFKFELKGYAHFRCAECGSVFVSPIPSPQQILEHYEDGAFYEKAREDVARRFDEGRRRVHRLERILPADHTGATLLDVGCGDGVFLRCAMDAAFQVSGVEPSGALVSVARTVADSVQHADIESAQVPQRFEVVTAWEVLEHLARPTEAFATIVSWLKPRGLVGISTPLADGLPARMLGRRFPMFIPPEHLCLFSRRALLALAGQHGLRRVRITSESNLDRQTIAGFVFKTWPRLESALIARLVVQGLAAIGSGVCGVADYFGWGTGVEIWFRREESS